MKKRMKSVDPLYRARLAAAAYSEAQKPSPEPKGEDGKEPK